MLKCRLRTGYRYMFPERTGKNLASSSRIADFYNIPMCLYRLL